MDDVNQDCGPEDPHLEAPDGDLVVARSHVTLAVVLRSIIQVLRWHEGLDIIALTALS